MDNKTSHDTETFICKENTCLQYTPPNIHCTNPAERETCAWKNHFLSGVAGLPKTFPITNCCCATRSAFSYLASEISTTRLVALQVLIGYWVRQALCQSALVMLGLSCRLAMLLMIKRILPICIVFSLKSNTTPRSCIVYLPIMRSYIGAWSPGLYSTMSS
jgi:hypothetical protein